METLEQLRQTILNMGPVCPRCGAAASVRVDRCEDCRTASCLLECKPCREASRCCIGDVDAITQVAFARWPSWFPHWEVRPRIECRAAPNCDAKCLCGGTGYEPDVDEFLFNLHHGMALALSRADKLERENAELKQRIAELEAKAPRVSGTVGLGPLYLDGTSPPRARLSGAVRGAENHVDDALSYSWDPEWLARLNVGDKWHYMEGAAPPREPMILPLPKCTAVGCVHPVAARAAVFGLQLCAHHDRIAMAEQVSTAGEPVSKIEDVPGTQVYNPWDPEGQVSE